MMSDFFPLNFISQKYSLVYRNWILMYIYTIEAVEK